MMAQGPNGEGMLARMRYTPMRDVIRLRLTGRLNIRSLIAQANLPQPLGDLVLHVARRTRLSRLEKVDVAEELVAHFADGLDAGRSAEQLLRDFGDADRAARLIRRAKRRNHNALQRVPRYSVYGLSVLALFYLIIAIRFFSGSPTVSHDYLADLNKAAAAAPPEQSAWPLYRSALLALDELPTRGDQEHVRPWGVTTPMRPGDDGWEVLASYLAANQQSLALARQASARPHLGFVASHGVQEEDRALWPEIQTPEEVDVFDGSLISVRLSHLSELGQLAMLFAADAWRAAADDDQERSMANIAALLGMSGHAREVPTIVSELTGMAILNRALDTTLSLLAEQPEVFDDAALAMLADRIQGAHGGEIRLDLSSERYCFHDLIQRLYTDDGRGNGRITSEGMKWLLSISTGYYPEHLRETQWYSKAVLPGTTLLMANRRDMLAKYNEIMDRMERESAMPLWQRTDTVNSELAMMMGDSLQWVRYAPVVLMTPAIGHAATEGDKTAMKRDATLAAIAMILHHRRHGAWPQSLDELAPQLLPQVPLDRYDGQPLRYTVRDGSPVLYSIGMNRIDNGGMSQQDLDRVTRRMEGDWIFWPPPK